MITLGASRVHSRQRDMFIRYFMYGIMICYFNFFTEFTYRHHVELDGQFLSLDVLDTAGKVRIYLIYKQ